jgi:glutaminase
MQAYTEDEFWEWVTEAESAMDQASITGALPFYQRNELNNWAAAVATLDGVRCHGAVDQRFTLMSSVKPFLLLYLLETQGSELVFSLVGQEASDQPFYSVSQLLEDGGKPRNAMINSGAMLLADQLPGNTPDAALKGFLRWLNDLAGTSYVLNHAIHRYCLKTEDQDNQQLATLLAQSGATHDADRMFDVYFRLCCLEGRIEELAKLGLLLTFPHPKLTAQHQQTVREVMQYCGLYEASNTWLAETGIPAKSGVSGALVGILQQKCAIATFSPWLNEGGNPVLAMSLLKVLGQAL